MAASRIVEAFDEGECRMARLGLCLEPAAIEELAFERGEEALTHGIVVCVADRTHRGAHARVTAAAAGLSRGGLGTLGTGMEHAGGSARQKRHVQRVKYQLRGKRGGHRPADDAATVRIEHDSQIEKASPSRYISNVRHPPQISRLCDEVSVDQVRCLTAIALDRGDDELASAHTDEVGL